MIHTSPYHIFKKYYHTYTQMRLHIHFRTLGMHLYISKMDVLLY